MPNDICNKKPRINGKKIWNCKCPFIRYLSIYQKSFKNENR